MPWLNVNLNITESIKTRACAYLLDIYLGQYFEKKLTLNQLSLDLYNGTGTLKDIILDVQALNDLAEKQNWPLEFVDGCMEELCISIPWAALLKESSFIEVRGLRLTLQPKQRSEHVTSMFESMWSSMTNSIQLAEECVKRDLSSCADKIRPIELVQRLAQTIEQILNRVKVKFIDTVINIEHVPKDSSTGVAIQINLPYIEYMDAAGNDPPTGEASDPTNMEQNKTFVVNSFTVKNFYFEGVTFATVEFPSKARTFSRSAMTQSDLSAQEKTDSLVTMIGKDVDANSDFCDESESRNTKNEDGSSSRRSSVVEDERHVIQFGRLIGKQHVTISLKQSEEVRAAKVSIQFDLGSIILFLSPRQVYVLLELANGLARPDTEDTSNVLFRQRYVEKLMTDSDYQRIEQELQQNLHPLSTFQAPGLQGIRGWSTAAFEESDSDENFLPLKGTNLTSEAMCDSTLSGVSSSMESSFTTSMASSLTEQTSRTKRRGGLNIDNTDPTAEISHFNISVASLALIVLHEDILTLSADQEQTIIPSSVRQMQNTVETFFCNLGIFGNKDFDSAKTQFEKACSLNHLRLLAAPVHLEINEKTTSSYFTISGSLAVAKFELLECLNNGKGEAVEYVKLISFADDSDRNLKSGPLSSKPSLKLALKYVEKFAKTVTSRSSIVPKTDLEFILEPCAIEVDITIVDRICALLNQQPVCVVNKPNNVWGIRSTALSSPQSQSRIDLKITSSALDIKLRFPIPDFRPPHSMQRNPWWKRHVRSDYIVMKLTDAVAFASWYTNQPCQKYVLECNTGDVYYVEADTTVLLPIGKVTTHEKDGCKDKPRLILQIYPIMKPDIEFDQRPDSDSETMNQSIYGVLGGQYPKQIGPFSAKRIVHESDTPHGKPQQDDVEEMVIPGDKQEISDFIEQTTQTSRIRLQVFLPDVSLQLISKHIYELLYNRINNDLLLWEPSAPKPKTQVLENVFPTLSVPCTLDAQEMFSMCRSGIKYDSDSDTDEGVDSESTGIYYSASDRMKQSHKRQIKPVETKGQSYMVLDINIGRGLLCMHVPVRDVSLNVIPGQHGEFLFNVEDVNVFSVTGYQGDNNLGFVCVQAHNAQLYHCDMISTPSQSPPLKEIGTAMARHLQSTIYKSERGIEVGGLDRTGGREMISVAVQIQASHETHHVKTVRVALGISKATLRHRMCQEPNSWISQLIYFFNVLDYPIPGYHAKDVLTELHLHTWNCAIDYRPLYLPLRSVVTLGNFTVSSHLSAQANTSTLRFIAEDCSLFLSEKGPAKSGIPSSTPVDLKRDYVNVVELGLFELSIRTNDKNCGINPHFDLRASNNIVRIRTCADSGRALMELIRYIAGCSDLELAEAASGAGSNYSSPRHKSENELVSVEAQDICTLSKSQHQHVNDLIDEAMKESINFAEEALEEQNFGAKLFYFPDEGSPFQDQQPNKPLPQVTQELGDITYLQHKNSDTDDEFCFVGDEAGLGILPKNGLPEIRWLTEDPLRIIDNHFFIPAGRTDLLKPPKSFPTPITRYTLLEMSLVWHMYGGNDFRSADETQKQKKTVNFSDTFAQGGVGFSNTRSGEVIFANFEKKKKHNLAWQIKGGINRDHDVLMEFQFNKIQFQHEIYPDNTPQASRQVILVNEVEIRDRLASSEINKFLYQYISQARPKQSHTHMIQIKALHIRPDPKLKTQECNLKVSLTPLRLNIDQDALLFLINFFTELNGSVVKADDTIPNPPSRHSTPTHQPPIMTVNIEDKQEVTEQAQKMVDKNLLILLEESKSTEESTETPSVTTSTCEDIPPIYFRCVIFSPEVLIRLDYHGKRVDMTHGPLPGLLMGLAQLNCSELKLRRLSYRHGLLGVDKLVNYCMQEWLKDIKKNQLPSLLGGVGPMHSLVQLFQGVRDLFWLPIEQYQKDGRIIRGLQRGANSFTTSTAMAALELTSRLIHLLQITAETAYDMVSPGPSVKKRAKIKGKKRRYTRPQDIREGMANAYHLVKEGIGETATNIVRVASHEHEQKGYSGAVGGVLREIPSTVVKPILLATEAGNHIIDGVHNQLVPDARREANQKWRSNDDG